MFRTLFRRLLSRKPQSSSPRRKPSRAKAPCKLNLELLEDRMLLANLMITKTTLTDKAGNVLNPPPVGGMAYVQVEFDTTDLSATAQYTIRQEIDGDSKDFTVTGAAWGSGVPAQHVIHRSAQPWLIKPGQHSVKATVDATNTIAEDSETDNLDSFSVVPITFASKFVTPLGGVPYQTWTIAEYVDLDPLPGSAKDYTGGKYTYDGHTGIDYMLANFAAMDAGIPVLAAAEGIVAAVHDGEFDRNTTWENVDPAKVNLVILDHGGGWKTGYLHLRTDSVTVTMGQHVNAGETIGLVGSSGKSTDAHLHFEVDYRKTAVEPYVDPTAYWAQPLPYSGDVPGVLDFGITGSVPSDLKERPLDRKVFEQSAGQGAFMWLRVHGWKNGDRVEVAFYTPDGGLYKRHSQDVTSPLSYGSWVIGWELVGWTDRDKPDLGTWRIDYRHNGVLQAQDTFTVLPKDATGLATMPIS